MEQVCQQANLLGLEHRNPGIFEWPLHSQCTIGEIWAGSV